MKRIHPDSATVSLLHLPADSLHTIWGLLTITEIGRCALVCKQWQQMIDTSTFWQKYFTVVYPWIEIAGDDYKKASKIYQNALNGTGALFVIPVEAPRLIDIIFDKNTAIFDYDNTVRCIDLKTGSILNELDTVHCANAIVRSQTYFATSSMETICVWDLATKKLKAQFKNELIIGEAYESDINCLVLDEPNTRVFSGDVQNGRKRSKVIGTVKLWNLQEPNTKAETLFTHHAGIRQLALFQESLAIGCEDGTLALFRLSEPKTCIMIKAHASAIQSLIVYKRDFPKEDLLISCAKEGIKVWDLQTLRAKDDHPLAIASQLYCKAAAAGPSVTFEFLAEWDRMFISTISINHTSYALLWNIEGHYAKILQSDFIPDYDWGKPIRFYQDKLFIPSGGNILVLDCNPSKQALS
jgi:WD40 repeat protein